MKYLLPFLLFVFACKHNPARQAKVPEPAGIAAFDTSYKAKDGSLFHIKDFNADGQLDTLEKKSGSGSGFSGTDITLKNGKTGYVFKVDEEYCFCSFRSHIYIPADLAADSSAAFLAAVAEQFGVLRKKPDPALHWVQYGLNHVRMVEDNALIKRMIEYPNTWLEGKMERPSQYTLLIEPGDWALSPDMFSKYQMPAPGSKYLLVYRGRNHYGPCGREQSPFTEVAKSAAYKIWATCHGLILEKDGRHKWIFISDVYFTGAPAKLRHASIGKVALIGQFLFFQQTHGFLGDQRSRVWVVDLENDVCAETTQEAGFRSFELSGDSLHLELYENGKRAHGVSDLLSAFQAARGN